VLDAFNNVVTTNTSNVTVAIGSNPGGGTLSGTTTVAAVAGVATFSNLSINNHGTGYTLTAAGTSLTAATSTPFNITGAPVATHFTVTASPGSITAGNSVLVQVTALDASNNTVTGYNGTVHFTSTDPQAVLPPNTTL